MTSSKPVAFEPSEPPPTSPSQLGATTTESEKSVIEGRNWSFWTVFSSTFLTIFLAEMGDKTQLATLLMSAESQSPWIVFAGAATALVATSLLGVVIGYWIARRLSPKTLDLAAALLLLLITGLLISDQ
jgi:putative Ca2+/H+ antiporter (TMEM165/GDT1 family)